MKQTRLELLKEFDAAPLDALFSQDSVAAWLACSAAKLERDRWAGIGVPFVKIGRSVRYRKIDVVNSIRPPYHAPSDQAA